MAHLKMYQERWRRETHTIIWPNILIEGDHFKRLMHGEKQIIETDCLNCVWENFDFIHFIPEVLNLLDILIFSKGRDFFRSAE